MCADTEFRTLVFHGTAQNSRQTKMITDREKLATNLTSDKPVEVNGSLAGYSLSNTSYTIDSLSLTCLDLHSLATYGVSVNGFSQSQNYNFPSKMLI